MRKMILALLAASVALPTLAVPTMASAQSAREVRQSERNVKQQQRDVQDAKRYGTRADVRDERRDVKHAKQELREDWRDYKRANRNVYHRPAYVGPRGYSYRPVAVGHRLAPAYYGSRYRVTNYQRYRLPAPGYNNRWVRYGNDVVLVNVRSGSILRVYAGFFW